MLTSTCSLPGFSWTLRFGGKNGFKLWHVRVRASGPHGHGDGCAGRLCWFGRAGACWKSPWESTAGVVGKHSCVVRM